MEWFAYRENFNQRKIERENILAPAEEAIKKIKKENKGYAGFGEALDREMKYRYWSRCEHELLLEKTSNGRFLLKSWIDPEDVRLWLDVTETPFFDWEYFLKNKPTKTKIDVYDQLRYRWSGFCLYCWDYKF